MGIKHLQNNKVHDPKSFLELPKSTQQDNCWHLGQHVKEHKGPSFISYITISKESSQETLLRAVRGKKIQNEKERATRTSFWSSLVTTVTTPKLLS